jgi:hypothetical protein
VLFSVAIIAGVLASPLAGTLAASIIASVRFVVARIPPFGGRIIRGILSLIVCVSAMTRLSGGTSEGFWICVTDELYAGGSFCADITSAKKIVNATIPNNICPNLRSKAGELLFWEAGVDLGWLREAEPV